MLRSLVSITCATFLATVVTVGQAQDPMPERGGYDGRTGVAKEKLLRQEGGDAQSEDAVAAGLSWVIRHQAADGHWGMHDFHVHGKCKCSGQGGNHDIAGTAFGLLPLLAAGETHKGGKNRLYAKNVERALKWLLTQQTREGAFQGKQSTTPHGYEHALATITLCEAYAMTGDTALKGPAQRAVTYCINWQHADGGFRYMPRTPGDPDVTAWFVQALKAGQLAGFSVPQKTVDRVHKFLDSTGNADGSGYGYLRQEPSPSITGAGLLSRQYLGWDPQKLGLKNGIEYLGKQPPSRKFRNVYYYYYATQVMRNMAPVAPKDWESWNGKMRDLLIDTQDLGANDDLPDQKGSWSPAEGEWGGELGRLGYTSLALLTLEVYYRHAPLYRDK